MLQAISQINEAEKNVQNTIQSAISQASTLRSNSKKDGKDLLASLKQESLAEYKDVIEGASDESSTTLSQNKASFEDQAKEIFQKGSINLTQAAQLVVERIVSNV